MSQGRRYGHIPGFPVGHHFNNRDDLMKAGVHCERQAGIHGDSSPNGGAFSICLSGGYEDDEDNGERIIYVGSGGQDSTRRQVANQSPEDSRNKSLFISCETKRPVRVIRGTNNSSYYSPETGYRYDGLYVVDLAEFKPGKHGFKVCLFKLRRIHEEGQRPIPTRRLLTTQRLASMLRNASN